MHTHPDNSPAAIIFWIAAVICIIAELALLRSAFFPRLADSGQGHSPARGSEMLWAVIPAVGLMLLLAATWRAVNH